MLAGITSGVGAVIPAAYGSTLATRLLSGAAANTTFGAVNRYADHKILEAGGYPEMAAQQKALDGTQMLVDAALGVAFGGVHHLQASAEGRAVAALQTPAVRDAALTVNLALRDRAGSWGVPVDPAAAAAHQAALETATSDLLQGKPVDVSGTGVDQASFLSRPSFENPAAAKLMLDSFKWSGLVDEEANLADLEAQFARRLGTSEPQETTASVKPGAAGEEPGYSVREEPLTDDQLKAFQGLRSDVQADEDLPGSDEGRPAEQGRPQDAGGRGSEGAPLRVYRGGERPVGPEHFAPETAGSSTGHPSSGLGVYFTSHAEDAAQYGRVSESHLDVRNPKVIPVEDLPGFDTLDEARAYREKLKGEGHDGIVIDASHVGGPVHYVAFDPKQVIPAAGAEAATAAPIQRPLAERLKTDADLRAGLESMKGETGWAQEGGRLIRDPDTQAVTGRTGWVPNADWWAGRPKGLKEAQVHAAVDKALAGEALSKPEARMVQFMSDVHDERVAMAQTHAQLREAVPELAEQPAAAVDITLLASRAGEHDANATADLMDTWTDDKPETLARLQGELERIIGRGHETQTLETQAARTGEPATPTRSPRAIDLFGEDRSQEQALADETRRRDLQRSPNRDVALETGRPDDLFSQSRQQIDLTDQALADRPNLEIPDENGQPVKAADELAQTDTAAKQQENDWATATKAATDCFTRKGG